MSIGAQHQRIIVIMDAGAPRHPQSQRLWIPLYDVNDFVETKIKHVICVTHLSPVGGVIQEKV